MKRVFEDVDNVAAGQTKRVKTKYLLLGAACSVLLGLYLGTIGAHFMTAFLVMAATPLMVTYPIVRRFWGGRDGMAPLLIAYIIVELVKSFSIIGAKI